MTDCLRLQIYLDDDGTAELFARVEANGFAGNGSAWVDPRDLVRLSADLGAAFPLRETLQISGGYWSSSTPGTLEQEHVSLSFYPVAGRGVAGCQIRLATPVSGSERPAARHFVQAELLTSYQELQEFAKMLGQLATGSVPEAVLNAAAV